MEKHWEHLSDGLKLPGESRGRIRAQLASQPIQREAISMKKKASHLRGPLIAAALASAMLLTTCALAAALTIPVLREYFSGGAGYQQSSIFIGKSITSEGWTMTLTDCVGDDRRLYLGFTVEAPEGTVLDEDYYISYIPLEDEVNFSQIGRPNAHYWDVLPDEDPADNKINLVLWMEYIQRTKGETGFLGQTMELCLRGFGYYGDKPDGSLDRVAFCEGTWDFGELNLSQIDRTLRMDLDLPGDMAGIPVTITYLEVSPTGVNVWLEGEGLRGHEPQFPWGSCINAPEIVLYDKDGNTIDQGQPPFGRRAGSGCCQDPDAPDLPWINVVQSYENLLDMDSLDHIDVCGVSIPLS